MAETQVYEPSCACSQAHEQEAGAGAQDIRLKASTQTWGEDGASEGSTCYGSMPVPLTGI